MKRTKKRAPLFILIVAMVLISSRSALALPYYDAGSPDNKTYATAMQLKSGSLSISFNGLSNPITGPAGDVLSAGHDSYFQYIIGTYTLTATGTSGVYSLSGAPSTILVRDAIGVPNYLIAQSTATQINFNTHTISWSDITMATIDNSIGSTVLGDLADLAATIGSTFSFSSFTFEAITTEGEWLSTKGVSGAGYARYYSELGGFAAAPEPAEWMLIIIGLGLIGCYMHRRGYLASGSPEALA